VEVGGERLAAIGRGLLVLVGILHGDAESNAERLLERVASYRVFADDKGKMNLDVRAVRGELLVVPQFTLAADTDTGTRASFSRAAKPDTAQRLFRHFVDRARGAGLRVECGRFGADMKVALVNDGPVTFWLEA